MTSVGDIMVSKVITCAPDETLFQVLGKMNKTHKKELPVVDSKNKVKGMISYYDILDMRTPSNLKAETIMTNVPLLRKEESIENALDLMISSGIEAMAVADSHSKIIGIVSEYDLIKYFLNEGMFSKKEIPEFIRTNIKPLSIDDNLLKAKRKMGFYNVPLLPVVDKNMKFAGTVDASDIFLNYFTQVKGRINPGDYTGEMVRFMSESIVSAQNVLNSSAKTVNINAQLEDAVGKMLETKTKAITVVNMKHEVLGMILRKDVLNSIADVIREKGVLINFSGMKLDELDAEELRGIALVNVRKLVMFSPDIKSIEVHIKPVHYVEKKKFEMKMRLEYSGNDISIKEEGFDLFYTFERALKKLTNVVKKEFESYY